MILVIDIRKIYNDKFENKHIFSGEDDMDETGGQISNVGQQVDGSSDAEESQRLVSSMILLITLITLIIYSHEYYVPPSFFVIIIDNKLNILVSIVQKFKT